MGFDPRDPYLLLFYKAIVRSNGCLVLGDEVVLAQVVWKVYHTIYSVPDKSLSSRYVLTNHAIYWIEIYLANNIIQSLNNQGPISQRSQTACTPRKPYQNL